MNAAIFWVAARVAALPCRVRAGVRRRGDEQLLPQPALDVRGDEAPAGASTQFGRFLAVSVAALVSDLAVLSLLVETAALPQFLSALVAIGFTTPVSFGANRLWTFSHR